MAVLFKLSDAVAIGLHAAIFLASNREEVPVTAKKIAGHFKVSESHLIKVMQTMQRAGLIRSTRGPGGGYRLARQGSEIRLIDLVEAIEGRLEVRQCLLTHPLCHDRDCILGPLVGDVNRRTIDYLSGHTLKDLAERRIYRS